MKMLRSRGTKLFYFPEVEARLRQPAVFEDGLQSVSQFIRSYYIRGRDEQDALALLASDLTQDGADLVAVDGPKECQDDEIPSELKGKLLRRWGRGVWWRSGRVFYQVEQHRRRSTLLRHEARPSTGGAGPLLFRLPLCFRGAHRGT